MIALGVSKEGEKFFVAGLKKKKRSYEIIFLKTHYAEEAVKRLYKKGNFTTILEKNEVLIKETAASTKKNFLLKKTLPFQAENLTAIDKNELLWIPINVMEKNINRSLFHITSRDTLLKHLEEYKEFDPLRVTSAAQALFRFSQFSEFGDGLAIHLGMHETLLIKKENGYLKNSCSLPHGIKNLVSPLAKAKKIPEEECLSQISSLDINAYAQKNEEFSIAMRRLKEAIKEGIHYLTADNFNKQIFICGFWEKNFKMLFEKNHSFFTEAKNPSYALAIGAAIDMLSKDGKTIQFRKGPFFQKKYIKKAFTKATSFLILAFIPLFTLHLLLLSQIQKKEKELHAFLTKIREEDFKKFKTEQKFLPISANFEKDLERFEETLKKDSFCSFEQNNAPRVGSLLFFIKSCFPSGEIKSFSYEMPPSLKGECHFNDMIKMEMEISNVSEIESETFFKKITNSFAVSEIKKDLKGDTLKVALTVKNGRKKNAAPY